MDIHALYNDVLQYQDSFALTCALNAEPLSTELNNRLLVSFFHQFQNSDEDIRLAFELASSDGFNTISTTIEHKENPYDPTDSIGRGIQGTFPDSRIISILCRTTLSKLDQPISIFLFLIFPKSDRKPSYLRIDHTSPSIQFKEKLSFKHRTSNKINRYCDIRSLLGCREYQRRLTVLAGSPGWSRDEISIRREFISRNEGTLDATQNDFHSFTTLLSALGKDYLLPGITIPGLIRSKDLLFEIITCADNLDRLRDRTFHEYLRQQYSFEFNFWEDSQINPASMGNPLFINCNVSQSRFNIDDKSNLLINEIFDNDFPGDEKVSQRRPYIGLYYSGHGAPNGSLEIEKNVYITPEGLFEISQRLEVPFVICLDMCFSHTFGEKYQACLLQSGLDGLVLASNDGVGERLFSYESPSMDNVRRLQTPFRVFNETSISRGVYSTAFCLGMLKLRDLDLIQGTYTSMTAQAFNDELLIPICKWLSMIYSVPVQSPAIFSS